MARLPPPRAARLARLRSPADRLATLLGLALLLDCAAAAGLSPPPLAALEFPPRGKPRWPGGPDFSISHAGGHVACALAAAGVGVGLDMEPVSAVAWDDLRLVCRAGERSRYAGAGWGPAMLWTAKEAVIKAAGQPAAAAARTDAHKTYAWLDGRRYLLRRPRPARGLACTLATTAPVQVRQRRVPAGKLLDAAAPQPLPHPSV